MPLSPFMNKREGINMPSNVRTDLLKGGKEIVVSYDMMYIAAVIYIGCGKLTDVLFFFPFMS
jgi:hypothetical protein